MLVILSVREATISLTSRQYTPVPQPLSVLKYTLLAPEKKTKIKAVCYDKPPEMGSIAADVHSPRLCQYSS